MATIMGGPRAVHGPSGYREQERIKLAVADLVGRGYGIMPIQEKFQESARALVSYFTRNIIDGLSDKEKSQWEFHFPGNHKPDHGLCNRSRKNGRYGDPKEDDKWFFHWRAMDKPTRKIPELLSSKGIDSCVHRQWFDLCDRVWQDGLATIASMATEFDKQYNFTLNKALFNNRDGLWEVD